MLDPTDGYRNAAMWPHICPVLGSGELASRCERSVERLEPRLLEPLMSHGLLTADFFELYPSRRYMDRHQPGDSAHHPRHPASVSVRVCAETSSLHNTQSLSSLCVCTVQLCPETTEMKRFPDDPSNVDVPIACCFLTAQISNPTRRSRFICRTLVLPEEAQDVD